MRRLFTEKENSIFQSAGENFTNFIENIKEEIDRGVGKNVWVELKRNKVFLLESC